MSSSFGIGDSRSLRDVDLADVRHVVGEARLAGRQLSKLIEHWHQNAGLSIETRIALTDRRVQEVVLISERALPHRDWGICAGRLVHDARSALDHLNSVMMTRFAVEPFDSRKVYFPITENGKDWRSWRQRHRHLPDWAIARYAALQPSAGPFHGLAGLRHLDDASKHRHIVPVQLAVLGLISEGTCTLDGIPTDDEPVVGLETASNILKPGAKTVTVARLHYEFDILESAPVSLSVADIDPLFVFGEESYSLLELLNLPERVEAAIDYAAIGSVAALTRYQAKFIDPRVVEE